MALLPQSITLQWPHQQKHLARWHTLLVAVMKLYSKCKKRCKHEAKGGKLHRRNLWFLLHKQFWHRVSFKISSITANLCWARSMHDENLLQPPLYQQGGTINLEGTKAHGLRFFTNADFLTQEWIASLHSSANSSQIMVATQDWAFIYKPQWSSWWLKAASPTKS